MAKVSTLKFELKGINYEVPVNCGVSGIFKASLPKEVWLTLGIRNSELQFSKLSDLETEFFNHITRYREAKTTEVLLIKLRYKSKGIFCKTTEGYPLFLRDKDFYLETQWDSVNNAIGFDFEVFFEVDTDGHKTRYKAVKGKNLFIPDKTIDPEKYYKDGRSIDTSTGWITIPYSDEAFNTLEIASRGLRNLSELLYNFISKDPEIINQILIAGTSPLALNP
jgi:hypothetical protein